jgi:nucleotide-binding universal stress UspA family protein
MKPNRILVAHDFSEPSNRALRFATSLASQIGAKVEVVHVMPDVYDGRGELELALPATLPGQGERYMTFLQEELTRAVGLAVPELVEKLPCHALRGDPVKRIEELAKELGADVLCVGATGKGAVARVLLGSISQLLLRSSQVPVLVVP